ncbi:Hypothetical predicted protein [Olea europaea subsp. europaea]|uniref:cAMP-regulated phosphoprotein 19-related protein n=1 Tax=Olea europaea subsp. europaea TaxID=158383 RepID=A0A8S0QYT0_OLEEU|nr:Hypothetical predicted protein [Olea europaea subsp. europaea]
MSGESDQATQEKINLLNSTPEVQETENSSPGDQQDIDVKDENLMPVQQQEEELIKKKYGGLLPKKASLISKDHEHAFFDSADWALGKQGAQKSKGPLEALRPKLQVTLVLHHITLLISSSNWTSSFDNLVSIALNIFCKYYVTSRI